MKCKWIELLLIFLIKSKIIAMEPTWYETTDGKRFLIDVEKKYNWYQAWNECARYDAQLVAIESEQKNLVLMKLLNNINEKNTNLWTGGNVLYDKLSFSWAVNEHDFTFSNWDTDEVDNFDIKKHCVYLIGYKKSLPWNLVNCNAKEFGFICEQMIINEDDANTEDIRKSDGLTGSMYNGSIYGLIG